MGDLVNLKRFKKRGERDKAAKDAETNRALFGRTKAEKRSDEALADHAGRSLDAHRIDDGTSR